jgi:signal transduction histidine kinase/ligand-binding sensor domain-containing protein/DNA-binding NarL/FixJ family response regulator
MIKKALRFSIICFLLLLLPRFVFADFSIFRAENYTVRNWNIFSGLPSDSITMLYQDSKKYIWIGTFDGLIRYNGRSFQTFDATTTPGFDAHSAHYMLEDGDGALWIGTENEGLARFSDGGFTMFTIRDGLPSNGVKALEIDEAGTLWVGTNQGLVQYAKDGFAPPEYPERNPFTGRQVNFLFKDPRFGLVAACSDGGLYVHSDSFPEPIPEMEDLQVSAAARGSDGIIWIGTRQGRVFLLDENGLDERTDLYIPRNQIRDIHADGRSGDVWIAGNSGLFRIENGGNGSISFLDNEHSALRYLPKAVLEDHEGNLWIGTRSGGLFALIPSAFRSYGMDAGLTDATVNSAASDNQGRYWIAADDGLYCLENNRFVNNSATELLSGVRVKHVAAAGGRVYVSTISPMGAVIIDIGERGNAEEITYLNQEAGLPSSVVKKTLLDSSGKLWISTSNGFAVYETDGEITVYNKDTGFPSNEIYDLFEDSRGRIWISTAEDGLFRFEANGSYTRFTQEHGLSGEMVFSVYEDKTGRFWISTAVGVFVMETDDSIYPLTYGQGLPYLYVYNAVPVDDEVWFTSVRGAARASLSDAVDAALGIKETFSVEAYGIDDGLLATPNALSWPYISPDNTIWIPTHRGISVYDPKVYVYSAEEWPLYIEKLTIDGAEYPAGAELPSMKKEVDRLRFHFAALSYSESHRVRYSYRLEGYESAWSAPASEPSAVYTQIQPGEYLFSLRAYDDSGNMKGETALSFSIEPVFYQTPLFIAVIALFGAALAALIVLWRIRRIRIENIRLEREIRKRTAEVEEVHQKELALLADISHEIRTPLTVIEYGLSQILSGRYGEKIYRNNGIFGVLRRNSGRILVIVNNLLHAFKLRYGEDTYRSQRLHLKSVLKNYLADFAPVAEKKGIAASFSCTDSEEYTVSADPYLFDSIILNLLSNGFANTPRGGKVSMSLESAGPETCRISIRDTGVGISQDEIDRLFEPYVQTGEGGGRQTGVVSTGLGSTGLGLWIVRKGVARIGGEISIASGQGEGTTVTLTLPTSNAGEKTAAGTEADEKQIGKSYAATIPSETSETTGEETNGAADTERGKPVLLAVEDNEDIRTIVADELGREFRVVHAENGKKAVEYLKQKGPPDIIVSDIMMPDFDGASLYHYVRDTLGLGEVPFLFVTARASPDEATAYLKEGVVDYVYKPFSPELLLYKARNLVRIKEEALRKFKNRMGREFQNLLFNEQETQLYSEDIRIQDVRRKFSLTEREAKILRFVTEGKRDKEIALALGCAVSTVSNTVSRIYKKTGTGSRVELIRLTGNIDLSAGGHR